MDVVTGMFEPSLPIWNLSLLHSRFDFELYDAERHAEVYRQVRIA